MIGNSAKDILLDRLLMRDENRSIQGKVVTASLFALFLGGVLQYEKRYMDNEITAIDLKTERSEDGIETPRKITFRLNS